MLEAPRSPMRTGSIVFFTSGGYNDFRSRPTNPANDAMMTSQDWQRCRVASLTENTLVRLEQSKQEGMLSYSCSIAKQ